jgi:putative ABC transport system substrate-binding protein
MQRREFNTLLGGAAAAWPLAVRAQQTERMRRIGVLMPYTESDADAQTEVTAFRDRLRQLGWTDGRNARIDYRWAAGKVGQIRVYAKELVALQPDVILGRSTPVIAALLQETRTTPIVFVNVSDPIGAGFAASMARPGGNVTGFTNVEALLGGKWLEVLKEINPRVARIAVMFNPETSPGGESFYLRLVQDAARSIGVETIATAVQDAVEIERAIEAFTREADGGLLVLPDVTTTVHRALIISSAARHRLPAVYPSRFYAAEGRLASYGIDPAGRHVRRSHSSRRETGRPSGAGPSQVRAVHQPKDGKGTWTDDPRGIPVARRRGHRMKRHVLGAAAAWPLAARAATRDCRCLVRFINEYNNARPTWPGIDVLDRCLYRFYRAEGEVICDCRYCWNLTKSNSRSRSESPF